MIRSYIPALAIAFGLLPVVSGNGAASASVATTSLGAAKTQAVVPSQVSKVWFGGYGGYGYGGGYYGYYRPYYGSYYGYYRPHCSYGYYRPYYYGGCGYGGCGW